MNASVTIRCVATSRVTSVHPRYRRMIIPTLLVVLLVIVVVAAVVG